MGSSCSSSSSKNDKNKNMGSQVVNNRSNFNMNDHMEKPTNNNNASIQRPNLASESPVLKKELIFQNTNIDANAGLIQTKVNDQCNFNMNDLMEKPITNITNNINANIQQTNLASENTGLKKELSFQNPNIDPNVGLIQSKVNDAKNQKKQNVFMCPTNKHTLTCDPPYTCVICEMEKTGLACQICKFHICYEHFGINLNDFNSKSKFCLFEHPLTFNTSPTNCIKCLRKFEDGYQCTTCKSFSLCMYCLGFDPKANQVNSNKCFFQHPLTLNTSPTNCIKCLRKFEDGYQCTTCKSFSLCMYCLGLDENLYKADSSKCFFQHPLTFYTCPISISCKMLSLQILFHLYNLLEIQIPY